MNIHAVEITELSPTIPITPGMAISKALKSTSRRGHTPAPRTFSGVFGGLRSGTSAAANRRSSMAVL